MGVCGIELVYALVLMIGPIDFGFIGIYTSSIGHQIRGKYNLSDTHIKWVLYSSIPFLTAIIGAYIAKITLSKTKGSRKKTVFVVDCIAGVSWLLNCLTKVNIIAGIITRALCGLALGAFVTISPMYLVEIAPSGYSGVFGSMNQFAIVLGNILYSVLGPYLDYMELNYLAAGVSVLQAILIWFIIESPDADQESAEEKPTTAVFQRKYAKGLIVGIILMFITQFSGINGILTNISIIMSEGGLDINPNFQSAIAIAAQFISISINFLTVERLGRRIVWIISSAVCAVGLLLLALNEKFNWSTVLPVVCIFIYFLGFGYGIGSICWFIVSEIFEADVRSAANSVCVITNWAFSFVMVMVFPSMKKSMKMFGVSIFCFVKRLSSETFFYKIEKYFYINFCTKIKI
ncbi:glucose import [Tritrichomonas musculus]|uniref:Glucose import n=1 Tax=Tritrichomonas musculus TaxID=1915356 RepID=A0ABR2H7J9_9EUKA